jgi:hypothetical protein
MIDRIRWFYNLGQRANSEANRLSTNDFAAANAVNAYTLRTARRFAREYTKKELDELCSFRRPNGLPLHWGHVHYLLGTRNKNDRRRFQARAAKEGWSAQQLRVAIQQEYGARGPKHGRGLKRPSSPSAGLFQLVAESEQWRSRCDMVLDMIQQGPKSRRMSKLKGVAEAAKQALIAFEQAARTATETED